MKNVWIHTHTSKKGPGRDSPLFNVWLGQKQVLAKEIQRVDSLIRGV